MGEKLVSAKTATIHDELDAEKSPDKILRNYKILRPDRVSVRNENCFIIHRGQQFRVLDYSPFGLGVAVPKNFEFGETAQVQLFYDRSEIGRLDVKFVRGHELNEKEVQCGFEIVGAPLDAQRVETARITHRLMHQVEEERTRFSRVPEEVQAIVYEIKNWMQTLKARVGELEATWRQQPDEETQKFQRMASEELSKYLDQVFQGYYTQLEELVKHVDGAVRVQIFNFYRHHVGPFIYEAPYANRGYFKPLGYAGDYEMMNHLYDNVARGLTLFAKSMHKYCIDLPAGQAVRGRNEYLYRKVAECAKKAQAENRVARILSVACGPANEVKRFMIEHPELAPHVEFFLLDQDIDALKFAQGGLYTADHVLRSRFKLTFINQAVKNVIEKGLGSQDLDLIYTAGLFDYLSDPVAVVAAQRLVQCLSTTGQLVIGNFGTMNPNRFSMEIALDWKLIYRSEQQLKQLFSRAGRVIAIDKEGLGINLFAIVEKSV